MNSFWGTQGQQSTSANDETPITANFWESSAAPPDPGPDEKSANFWESSVKPEISGLPDEWLAFEFWTGEMIQNEGPGNSIIVVGQAAPNQYTQADIDRPLGVTNADLSNLVSLEDINGYAGEQQVITDLPGGVNRLFLYGDVDLTSYNLAHIDWILPVRSQVSFTAQQLANLDPAVLYGDTRDSILRISNDSDQPITLNLDARIFTNFNALEIGEGVTLVVDQMALNGLQYISGEGAIQASNNARNLDFDGIFLTAAAQDRFGREIDPTETGGTRLDGQVLIAKNAGETLVGGEGNDRLIGGSGDNVLDATAGGDNILRAGAGRNEMYGGEGDDIFVLLGDLSVGGKQDDDFSTFLLGEPLSDLNGQNWALGASGVIDGGGGDNALHVFGDVDLTNYEIRHIDKIIVRSDVIFTTDQLEGVREMQGDGRSVITINSRDGQPAVFDLSELNLQGVGQIEIGASVTLEVDSLEDLGGARILTGQGTLRGKDPDHPIELTEEYTALNTVTVENADGTDARGQSGELDEVIAARRPGEIFNSDSNNYLVGTEYADVFVLDKNGDDVVNARAGDDTFIISGRGTKILMSSDGTDTIDLSQAAGPAVIDLTMGGKIAASETEIQLGTAGGRGGVFQEAPENNVMIIFDTSASMNVGTRRADAIDAANNLLDAYDNLGDVAVRFVTFDAGASAEFPASFSGGAWMDVSTAKDIITNIQTPGSATNFEAALNQAMQAYDVNQGNVYFPDGQGHSFFLSDGDENRGNVFNVQDQWQQFLIDNQVISNAIGFGGATRLDKLHPIAFNGVTGEDLDASLTLDSSQLGELVLGQAALDFIENLTGTPYDDALTGNALDNVIIGTGGDNIFKGLGGDDTLIGTPDGHDVAVYRGNLDEYTIRSMGDRFIVRDDVAGRDGRDVLIDINVARFADQDMDLKAGVVGDVDSGYQRVDYSFELLGESGGDPFTASINMLEWLPSLNFNLETPPDSDFGLEFEQVVVLDTWFTNERKVDFSGSLGLDARLDGHINFQMPFAVTAGLGQSKINYNFDVAFDYPEEITPGESFNIRTHEPTYTGGGMLSGGPILEASLKLLSDIYLNWGAVLDYEWSVDADFPFVDEYGGKGEVDLVTQRTIDASGDNAIELTLFELSNVLSSFSAFPGDGESQSIGSGEMKADGHTFETESGNTINLGIYGKMGYDFGNLLTFDQGVAGVEIETAGVLPSFSANIGLDDDLFSLELNLINLLSLIPTLQPLALLDGEYKVFDGELELKIPGTNVGWEIDVSTGVEWSLVSMLAKLGASPLLSQHFAPGEDGVGVNLISSWGEELSGFLGDTFTFTPPWEVDPGSSFVTADFSADGLLGTGFGVGLTAGLDLRALDAGGKLLGREVDFGFLPVWQEYFGTSFELENLIPAGEELITLGVEPQQEFTLYLA